MKFKKDMVSWAKRHPIYFIIIGGVLLRLLIAFLYQHVTIYPDSEDYIILAQRMLSFDFSGYEGQRTPGYPALLCLSNISMHLTAVLQSILGIATLVYYYKTVRLSGVKNDKALFITALTMCYIPCIFFEYAILTETLTLFCITTCFYILFKILKTKKDKLLSYVALSLLFSFLVLIKPFYIYLTVIVFTVLLFHNIRKKESVLKVLIIVLFPAICFIGWSAVNKANTGYFVSTTYYGFNLAQNCVSFAENTNSEYSEIGQLYAKYRENNDTTDREVAMSIWQAYPELKTETRLSFPDLSNELYHYSIATIKLNPIPYLKQVAISWSDFWKTSLYWEYDSFTVPYANWIIKYICYAERVILQLIKILFVLMIPLHFVRFRRSRSVSPQFIISLVVFAASIIQAFATYGTNSRFSFPFEMLIIPKCPLELSFTISNGHH